MKMETSFRKEQQKLHLCVITDTSVDRSEEQREREEATTQKVQQRRRQKTKGNIRSEQMTVNQNPDESNMRL